MCVRTDENPEVFVLCGFCRPEARRSGSVPARFPGWNLMFFVRGKTRKELAKVVFSHFCEIRKDKSNLPKNIDMGAGNGVY